eukprot:scaffold30951_cov57-Phaeocystis_antarctica.AAC.5
MAPDGLRKVERERKRTASPLAPESRPGCSCQARPSTPRVSHPRSRARNAAPASHADRDGWRLAVLVGGGEGGGTGVAMKAAGRVMAATVKVAAVRVVATVVVARVAVRAARTHGVDVGRRVHVRLHELLTHRATAQQGARSAKLCASARGVWRRCGARTWCCRWALGCAQRTQRTARTACSARA